MQKWLDNTVILSISNVLIFKSLIQYLVAVGLVAAEGVGTGQAGRSGGDLGGGEALAGILTHKVVLLCTVQVLPQTLGVGVGQTHTGSHLITCKH